MPTNLTAKQWNKLRDAGGPIVRFFRERKRKRMEAAMAEADLLTEDGWTTDDCNTGIIYQLSHTDEIRRVSVEVYMAMKTISLGIGTKSKWDRESARKAS